ncbi:MAG TPA: hypothetical protein VMG10_14385 [Gemmataceae bacterium]|nr:hypothetical protein [Gemmataceae bacterium]
MTNDDAALGFVGWHRAGKGERWRPLVEAETESDAFSRLLDAAKGGDKTVLPRGVDPNKKPATMKRRRF